MFAPTTITMNTTMDAVQAFAQKGFAACPPWCLLPLFLCTWSVGFYLIRRLHQCINSPTPAVLKDDESGYEWTLFQISICFALLLVAKIFSLIWKLLAQVCSMDMPSLAEIVFSLDVVIVLGPIGICMFMGAFRRLRRRWER